MQPLSMPGFIARRLVDDWKMLLSIFLGITIATGLVAGAPVYILALERQGINTAIDRADDTFLDFFVYGPNILLSDAGLGASGRAVDDAIERHIFPVADGNTRRVKSPNYLVGHPTRPLPDKPGAIASRGYFQYLLDFGGHVTVLEGAMPTDAISQAARGPIVEAVISESSARTFGLRVDDLVTLTPSLAERTRVSARIVGIVEPTDRSHRYWHDGPGLIFEPRPLDIPADPEVRVDAEEPPLPVFVTEKALIEAVGRSYPGTLVISNWIIFMDRDRLKGWTMSESRARIGAMDGDLALAMQGSAVFTGIKKLLDDFEERSFYSSVPLLLLIAVMVVTVLYYLSMMVSYLVQSRENDLALLRSRGVTLLQLVRLYSLEGVALTIVAVTVAPFLALGVVALSGKLPYFSEITSGDMLPVELRWSPFLAAAGAGLLSLVIFVVPGLVGARSSLVGHKLRSSRPPTVPLFQRYYLDIALLVVGGLIFWELEERGQLISGGLFKDVEVNEALLLAPVLFLAAVALVFMRLFPLFVRYISGESPALVHLVAAATLVFLSLALIVREVEDGHDLGWVQPVALLAALAALYWATQRARGRWYVVGLALQALIVGLVVYLDPPDTDGVNFIPTMALVFLVPAQLIFALFKALAQVAPVWLAMGLWHMARNPLQYSWLVLLLVLVTGLGILATTVGGTLDRSREDRIKYEVGADVRVSGLPAYLSGRTLKLKELYLTIPGVTSVSLAHRGTGSVGASFAGSRFEVLALESQDFPYISWYRDDFSDLPLTGVMMALRSNTGIEPVMVPEGATSLGVWAKPRETYANVFLWMVVRDARGAVETITLGELGPPEWRLMSAELPRRLQPPLELESVQIYEPVFGPAGTPGALLLDDIHARNGIDGEEAVLDDFEGQKRWTPLATSMISSDRIRATGLDVHSGERAGLFVFGKETDGGIRGFYRSPSGGPLPIVVSSTFLAATGTHLGDDLIISVLGRKVPVVIRDVVSYFPTLNPVHRGFILADLDGLLRHLSIVSPSGAIAPNELFIADAPGAGEAVREAVRRLVGPGHLVRDKDEMLESVRLDPLVTAGWKAMVLVSLGIILFTAGLGYVTYLLSFAERNRTEMGFLQSLGLSRGQLIGLVSLEHIVIVLSGLALGTWAGFQMSTLMISSVAVTETGQQVVPPFIRTTDWGLLAPIYVALVGIFLAALYSLIRSVVHLNLHAISRVEGD